jgi:hypothetical protein
LSGLDGHELWRTDAPDDSRGAFGLTVAGVGDANGDGIGDALAGDPVHGYGVTGQAYLLSGADGAVLRVWAGAWETDEFFLSMPGHGFDFGAWVAALGDVNGDGRADMIVGEDRYQALGYPTADRAWCFPAEASEGRRSRTRALQAETRACGSKMDRTLRNSRRTLPRPRRQSMQGSPSERWSAPGAARLARSARTQRASHATRLENVVVPFPARAAAEGLGTEEFGTLTGFNSRGA